MTGMSHDMRITRRNIIDAIRYEPLAPGSYVGTSPSDPDALLTQKNCRVCAVGGVFRRALVSPTLHRVQAAAATACSSAEVGPHGTVTRARAAAESTLANGYPMNALSILFETYAQEYGGVSKKMRTDLIKAVKKLYPVGFVCNVETVE